MGPGLVGVAVTAVLVVVLTVAALVVGSRGSGATPAEGITALVESCDDGPVPDRLPTPSAQSERVVLIGAQPEDAVVGQWTDV